jgi:Flp pilus assembly protein TadB
MAKRREERYGSMAKMVEDLKAVRENKPPIHAHRAVDLDSLAKIEETGKTVDIIPPTPAHADLWQSPVVIWLAAAVGASMLINVIMLVVLLTKK